MDTPTGRGKILYAIHYSSPAILYFLNCCTPSGDIGELDTAVVDGDAQVYKHSANSRDKVCMVVIDDEDIITFC